MSQPKLWQKHLNVISSESNGEQNKSQVSVVLPYHKGDKDKEEEENEDFQDSDDYTTIKRPFLAVGSIPTDQDEVNTLDKEINNWMKHYKPTSIVCLTGVEEMEKYGTINFLESVSVQKKNKQKSEMQKQSK